MSNFKSRISNPTFPNLKSLRNRSGLTQAAAAALLGVAPNTWSRWERGELRPSPPARKLIALIFTRNLHKR